MPLTWALAAAVVALQIPYPLVSGTARDVLTVATVLVFAAASLVHAGVVDGSRAAVALLVVAGAGGFAAEVLGVHSGRPFGSYRYTGGLGPTTAGVPLLIGPAWLMMTRPAEAVARRLVRGVVPRALVAAIALASWDVFLDPQMVAAHHWQWKDPTPHLRGVASVPVSNYGGWLLVALLLMAALAVAGSSRPSRDDRPMVALWLWTWLSSTLANVAFFGRPAVAAWGFAAMGVVGLPLVARGLR